MDIVPEEQPTKMDTTFLVSPPPTVEGGAGGVGGAGVGESLVVFCIDISGSMCVTTEVRMLLLLLLLRLLLTTTTTTTTTTVGAWQV